MTATQAANKLREQDLNAAQALNEAKPATLRAAQAIKDAGQLFPTDILVLAHELQLQIERYPYEWRLGKNVSLGLDDIQAECSGAMRAERERDAEAAL
jgi:hypothetical protein